MISLPAIPLAPLLAAVICLTVGRRWRRAAGWVAVLGIGISMTILIAFSGARISSEWGWLSIGTLEIDIGFTLDGLSWPLAVLVACISLLVNIYSVAYMRDDDGQARFFAWMSFFAGAMLALVLANSLVLLFAAWEGVGLASWALIGFWHREEEARKAARKAFLMTRLGDFGFLLAWLLVLVTLRTTHIGKLTDAVIGGAYDSQTLSLLAALFLVAAIGKSAQLPLSGWLPDAMAGPSPVSALIHSATMVAAGIYLVLRLYPVFEGAPGALTAMLWIGAATALSAALVATTQNDLKRVLAWSTISQLGEMLMALGLAGPVAATFHLMTHAVFKSGLFLTAGLVQHGTGTRQLQELGGLSKHMPVVAGIFAACALALAGFPLFSGYWSEEQILGRALDAGWPWGGLLILLVFLAGVYIGRAGVATFGNWPGKRPTEPARSELLALIPVGLLAAGAVVMGFLLKTPLEQVLPFAEQPIKPGLLWSLAAIGASVGGLSIGAWRVMKHGPEPALGRFPAVLASAIQGVTTVARAAVPVADQLKHPERVLDSGGRRAASTVDSVAVGVFRSETALDVAGRQTARFVETAAMSTTEMEMRGFAQGGDGFATSFLQAGRWLRGMQTGKVYLYTVGVFVWILVAAITFVALWL